MPDDDTGFDADATRVYDAAQAAGSFDGVVGDQLIEQYIPRLRAFIRARISEQLRRRESESDIVQSVCREIVRGRDGLDFPSESRFRAWLFTVAHNKIRHKGRFWGRERRSAEHEDRNQSLDELTAVYSGVTTPSGVASAHEQVERIESALDRLSDDHREVIALSRLARLPHSAIAEHLGKSVPATRQVLGRALRRLAEEIGR